MESVSEEKQNKIHFVVTLLHFYSLSFCFSISGVTLSYTLIPRLSLPVSDVILSLILTVFVFSLLFSRCLLSVSFLLSSPFSLFFHLLLHAFKLYLFFPLHLHTFILTLYIFFSLSLSLGHSPTVTLSSNSIGGGRRVLGVSS